MKSTALGLSRRAEGERRLWRPRVAARPADPEHIDGLAVIIFVIDATGGLHTTMVDVSGLLPRLLVLLDDYQPSLHRRGGGAGLTPGHS